MMKNAKNLFVALSLTMMIAACGKNMSLQVAKGDASQNQAPSTIDVTKVAQINVCTPNADTGSVEGVGSSSQLNSNESLQPYSIFDMNDLKDSISEETILKRSTLQIAPKEAVSSVLKLGLVLSKSHIMDASKASICIMETECRSLSESLAKILSVPGFDKTADLELDLREVFGLKEKSDVELMDWIYANTTEFARPGYRKFRFSFHGIESLEGGAVILQVITNEKLPKDFATAPTCYVHGEEDTMEPAEDETETPVEAQ